jgi:hypothetical protein
MGDGIICGPHGCRHFNHKKGVPVDDQEFYKRCAIEAMKSLMAQENLTDGEQATPQTVAEGAFAHADAMMEILSRKRSGEEKENG